MIIVSDTSAISNLILIPNINNILDELKIYAGFRINEDLYFEILKISDE